MKKYRLFSAIDLGSNSARMLLVQVDNEGKYIILENLVKSINMGEEVFKKGYVDKDSMKEVCNVLIGFKNVMKAYKVREYHAVATSALREVEDRDYIIDHIFLATGFKIEVINYCQETFLKYKALKIKCAKYLTANKKNLLLDVGAGGIEISVYKGSNVESSYHIKAGALRIRKFLEDLEDKTLNFSKIMEDYIYSKIYSIKNDIPSKGIPRLLIIGGESKNICKIFNIEQDENGMRTVSRDKLLSDYDKIREMLPKDLAKNYKLPLFSAEQIAPCMILIVKLAVLTNCAEIVFPFVSLKEGIVEEFIDNEINIQKKEKDMESIMLLIKNICRKYNYDENHANYVQDISMEVFEKMKKLHGLGAKEKFLLKVACQMHDIGKYVNIDNHYIHSFNIISSLNLVGISDNERRIIASIVRYHYLKEVDFDDDNYKRLTPKNRILVAKLTAILQFADSMDIRRQQYLKDPAIAFKNDQLIVKIISDKDCMLEEWIFKSQATLLTNVFGVNVVFKRSGNNL